MHEGSDEDEPLTHGEQQHLCLINLAQIAVIYQSDSTEVPLSIVGKTLIECFNAQGFGTVVEEARMMLDIERESEAEEDEDDDTDVGLEPDLSDLEGDVFEGLGD